MDTLQLKSSKILLIGELCLDRYLFGSVDRISPEAPVPVIKKEDVDVKSGMGGNVRNNLESLGNKVTFLHNEELITKTRIIDGTHNQQLLRIDDESYVDHFDMSSLPDLSQYDAVVISDYDKGFVPVHILYDIANKAYLKNVPIFIDTKKSYLNGITNSFIKLNASEYEALTCPPDKTNHTIVTRGSEGTMYRGTVYPAKEVSLAAPTGAGDTFLAAFSTAYLSWGSIPEAIKFANSCAAVSVTKLGCYAVRPEDINE